MLHADSVLHNGNFIDIDATPIYLGSAYEVHMDDHMRRKPSSAERSIGRLRFGMLLTTLF
jgi:hypothetical protein